MSSPHSMRFNFADGATAAAHQPELRAQYFRFGQLQTASML